MSRFIPLLTARAVVVPKPTAVEKFERAVIEASKQCGRNRLMTVDPPHPWAALLARTDLPNDRVVLHTGPGLATAGFAAAGVAIAIGPEGGFTSEEVVAATAAGWRVASLGPRVLRIETAAVAAAALAGSSPSRPTA